IDDCRNFVGWATEDGLDPETEIKCYDKTFKFKDVRAQVCEAFYQHCAKLYPRLAAREAKCKAIRDVLSGDKLLWFTGQAQKASNPGCFGLGSFQGEGGRFLETPDDFKTEPVWFEYTVDRTGASPRWELSRIPFNGMNKAGRPTSTSEIGTRPPASAFK